MAMIAPNQSVLAFSKPGTTDPAYLRKQALSQALMRDATSYRPAHSWGEALARALEGGVVGVSQAMEDKGARDRDKKFQDDFSAATANADPQKLAAALAGSGNADVQAMVPWQRMADAESARQAALKNEDRAWHTGEKEKDRTWQEQKFREQMAFQREIEARRAATANPVSFGAPTTVMGPDGKPMLVQFSNRGGFRPVDGVAPTPEGGEKPIFQDQPIDNDRVQKVVSYDGGRSFQPFGAPYSRREPFIVQEQLNPETGVMERVAIPREQVAGAMANRAAPGATTPAPSSEPPAPVIHPPQAATQAPPQVAQMPPQRPDGGVVLGPSGKPAFNEAQGKAAGFADRMTQSHGVLSGLEGEGTSAWEAIKSNVPLAGNYLVSEGRQKYEQAQRDFINAQLRRESGAVISPEEFDNARKQYFPQPGDSQSTIEQKRKNRQISLDAMRRDAGPAYRSRTDAAADPPSSGGGQRYPDGTIATNPQTGERVIRRNGKWEPMQ